MYHICYCFLFVAQVLYSYFSAFVVLIEHFILFHFLSFLTILVILLSKLLKKWLSSSLQYIFTNNPSPLSNKWTVHCALE